MFFFLNSSYRSVAFLCLIILFVKAALFGTELDFLSVWQHEDPPFGWILPLLMLLL